MNKKLFIMCAAVLLVAASAVAQTSMELKDVTGQKFSAEYLSGVTPQSDGESYSMISEDGKRIVRHSFKTGKQMGVIFDVDNAIGEKITKIEGYIPSPDGKKLLVQTNTKRIYRRSATADYYIYNTENRKLEKLSDNGPQQSPVWSPNGMLVAFVRDNNIFLIKLLYDNAESQVTKDGRRNEIINGIPDWVNEEEFGFSSALVFNADNTMLCWIRYDESNVREFGLQMYKGLKPSNDQYAIYPGMYSYKYPKAGEDNSKVTAMSYDIQSKKTNKLDVPLDADGYMPRIKATTDPNKVVVYTMNRHQDVLSLYAVNPRSTVAKLLIKESVPKYVKEETVENILFTSNNIVVPSDRDGHTRLYLYNVNGQLLRALTPAEHEVTDVYGYDEATGNVYYQAAGRDPMNREVYLGMRNGKTQCLTTEKGWNSAIFSANYKYFVRQWSDADTPYRFAICDQKGTKIVSLLDNKALEDKLAPYRLPKKEFFTFKTSEGIELNGVMIKPADFDPSKKYPVIMWQYSGPGSQQVVNAWKIGSMGQGALFDEYLAQKGFIIACVDGRGTGCRGAEWEKCTYLKIGELESRDQVEAAIHIGSLPYVDKERIGIWGWSYGGFNTLMSMSEGREVFKAGVAVAPPTDWRYYDTVYTERYMRTPQENPSGYDINPINRAPKMHGKLLICHGLADDNVHPQNTFEYSEALVQADKDFRMNIYTNRNHSIYGGNTRTHLLRQIAQHFIETLK